MAVEKGQMLHLHYKLNWFVVFFFLFALLFSLNFEPAFKASCVGHAKEFPFSCQFRLISLLNQKASRTQFCWNFCFCDLRDFKFTQVTWIQVGDPTLLWKLGFHEIAIFFLQVMMLLQYVLCLDALLFVQGRSSNEMKPTLTSELQLKSGFLDNGNNPRGSSMFWGPTATPVAPSSYQMLPCTLHGQRANI